MTIENALKILGVTKEDDEKVIKLRFRKLIAKCHPDVVGSDSPEHLKKAQLLNEAYALLRTRTAAEPKKVVRAPKWKGKVKVDAFSERTIYMAGVSWEGEEADFYKVARGRYEWDPELEEFDCFLKSLNEVAMELLEKMEYQNGIYNDYEYEEYGIKAIRFDHQLQLFHLLAGQFIAPLSSLKKLVEPIHTDDLGRTIYKIPTFIGAKGMDPSFTAMSKLQTGDMIYAASIKNNRIMVSDRAGTALGHLSLPDDHLYYVLIPILQNHLAQVKFVVGELDVYKSSRPYRIKVDVDLYLRMEKETKEVVNADQNIRIAAVLNRYEDALRKLKRR